MRSKLRLSASLASQSHTWSNQTLQWLATEVCAPVVQAMDIDPSSFPGFLGENSGIVLASERSPIRMSDAKWKKFNGICGHQHVPNNDHWDPGALDITRLVSFLGADTSGEALIRSDRYRVIARSGLRLRGGPGTEFEIISVLPTDSIIFVDSTTNGWARVDLEGDGRVDGFASAAFLQQL